MSSKPDLSDYVEVSERIQHFRDAFPDGSLQAEIVSMTDTLVVVKAYAYRTADDPRPGTGLASEPIPGKTPYTRDSELMNAETSAWGRAIIAVGASDAKRVASANEVRNRQPAPERQGPPDLSTLSETIADAQEVGLEGDYDATMEWASQSQANADAAVAKLRKAIAEKRQAAA